MALWYTLRLSDTSVDKTLIDQVLGNMNFHYSEIELSRQGFSIPELLYTCGFSITYTEDLHQPFGYEDEKLDEPFEFKTSITLRVNRESDQNKVLENLTNFFLSVLRYVEDDAILTLIDNVYMIRKNGDYKIYSRGGIWETPSGRAFLIQTPHTLLD